MFNHLNPENPEDRRAALQERTQQLMREKSLDYTTAWTTANAEPEMQRFVQAMKRPFVLADHHTGNAASRVVEFAVRHFVKGAVGKMGLPALRAEVAASPDAANLTHYLNAATANTDGVLENRPNVVTARDRMRVFGELVQKRMAVFEESYDKAFRACLDDPANAALTSAMKGQH